MDKFLKEVEQKCLKKHRELKKMGKLKNQSHYKSELKLLGLSIPNTEKVAKEGFSFNELNDFEKLKIWNHIWENSEYHEVKTLAMSFFINFPKDELMKKWTMVKKWMKGIENWAHSDSYSSIIASLYERDSEKIAPQIEKWNRSKNSWERRQSIVGLYYYSMSRKKQPSARVVVEMVKPLLEDDDYYVQKGVGWTLRELGNVEPQKHLKFLNENVNLISSTAFSAAVEKLNKTAKEKLKSRRKVSRKKKATV